MSASNIVTRDCLRHGELEHALTALGPDNHDTWHLDLPGLGAISGSLSRFGRTVVAVRADGRGLMADVFDSEAGAAQFYDAAAHRMRVSIERLRVAQTMGPDALTDELMGFLGAAVGIS